MGSQDQKPKVVLSVLCALSFCHLLNDMIQSLLPAIYPILKENYALDFVHIGIITLTFQLTASLLQPMVGFVTDKKPLPYSLPFGMAATFFGVILIAYASTFYGILLGAALMGSGSSIFHPESSRMARVASGGRHGFAQSLFQIGGNAGTAIGPLLAAYFILPHGQRSIVWFCIAAMCAMIVLSYVGKWYKDHHLANAKKMRNLVNGIYSKKTIVRSLIVLMILVFSKYFYMASMTNYYTFYLMEKFGITTQSAQIHLFIFLAAVAAGTLAGGPIGDKIGRETVIWVSILGVLPFTLILPYVNLFWTEILSVVIGVVIASAFSAIIVYAQDLAPGRTGTIAGLFFGFAFGMGGLGAAVFGKVADVSGIEYVYQIASYLPALGVLAIFLPRHKKHMKR